MLHAADPLEALKQQLQECRETGLPGVVVLEGETGRGKTYAVQRFFELLAEESPGYWHPRLTPAWPPTLASAVEMERKRIAPAVDCPDDAPPFWWFAASGSLMPGGDQDSFPLLVQQVYDQTSATVAALQGKRKLAKELANLGVDLLLSFVPFLAPAGPVKTLLQGGTGIAGALAGRPDARVELHRSMTAVAGKLGPRPVVVVLDDASGASIETLRLAAGFTAPDTSSVWISEFFDDPEAEPDPGGAERIFFPSALGAQPPLPVLYVVTIWSHRAADGFDDPIHQWIAEAADLGLPVVRVPCDELRVVAAQGQLSAAVPDLPAQWVPALMRHLQHKTANGSYVNPLALALSIGTLAERHAAYSTYELDEAAIAALPNSPDSRIRDRLETLKRKDDGVAAHALLHLAASGGQQTPLILFRFLGEQFPAWDIALLQERLRSQGMFSVPARPDDMPGTEDVPAESDVSASATAATDPDIHRFLTQSPTDHFSAQRLARAADASLTWLFREGLTVGPDSGRRAHEIFAIYRTLAAAVSASADVDARLAAAIVRDQINQEFPAAPSDASPTMLACAYGFGSRWTVDDTVLIDAFDHLGPCWLAARIAATRLRRHLAMPDQLAATAETALAANFHSDSELCLALARLSRLRGNDEQAVDLLRTHQHVQHVAEQLIALLDRLGRSGEAEEVMRAHPRSVKIAVGYAIRLANRSQFTAALRALEPVATNREAVAARARVLRQRGDLSEAEEVLREAAMTSPNLAQDLALLQLRRDAPSDAISTLEPFRNLPTAALTLARLYESEGRSAEAVRILQDLTKPDITVARSLVALWVAQGRVAHAEAWLQQQAGDQAWASVLRGRLFEDRDDHRSAEEQYRAAAASEPAHVLDLADFMIRRGRSDEAFDLLGAHLDASQDIPRRYVTLAIDTGRTDTAAKSVRTVSRWARNGAVAVAELLGRTNPGAAADLVKPWRHEASIAGKMCVWYARAERFDEAQAAVDASPAIEARTNRILLLSARNQLADAYQSYRTVPESQRRETLFRLFTTSVEMGQISAIAEFVGMASHGPVDQVAACTLLARRDDVLDDDWLAPVRAARAIWPDEPARRRVTASVRNALIGWTAYPAGAASRRLKPIGVAAMLEVCHLLFLPVPAQVLAAALRRVTDIAAADPRFYQALFTRKQSSRVAHRIIGAIDPPADWVSAER